VLGMREFHAGKKRHLHEVRHVRKHDGVFVRLEMPGLARAFLYECSRGQSWSPSLKTCKAPPATAGLFFSEPGFLGRVTVWMVFDQVRAVFAWPIEYRHERSVSFGLFVPRGAVRLSAHDALKSVLTIPQNAQ
jgi:hypothetical protein